VGARGGRLSRLFAISAPAPMDIPPCQTLYINNLNEKIKKAPLKKALYEAFSQFGKIMEIVTCRGIKLRGQAWVCFDTLEAATAAMGRMQNHPFFDKPMRIAYSKSPSDIVTKKDGTFKPREKRKREDKAKEAAAAGGAVPALQAAGTPASAVPTPMEVNNTPNSVLFASNLPEGCTEDMLEVLFKTHTGFKEVRMVPGKSGIAFIEFQDELKATSALQSLNGFKLTPTESMSLSFAKR